MNNPFFTDWDGPFGLAPFAEIEDAHFAPALEAGLADARENLARIAENADPATFENTIEALELSEENLSRMLGVFYGVAGADSTPAREALQRDFSPILSAFSSEITANEALFQRIEDLWAQSEALDLTEEQHRVLMLTRRGFIRSGAALDAAAKTRLASVKSDLASLGTQFTQNLLADERAWFMPLTDTKGLPQFVLDAATAAGEEKDAGGPVVTLSRSLIVPFLEFSENRALRQKAYAAWTARGANGGATDNRDIAAKTLKLREEQAQILGYESYADFKLETEMAGTPSAVRDLLMQVWAPARAAAMSDAAVLKTMLQEDGYEGPLEPWDWHFYAQKRRVIEHNLDAAEVKSYFQLDRMIEAAFACANRLFGLEFSSLDHPLYHADVRAWNVTRDGQHVAVFMGDYFARSSKRSGAWCMAMRSQKKLGGDTTPHVVNVCNFAKPAAGAPALLSYDDARTLFHEFGHALHQMLSDVTYESVSGTSVSRDFVELPSQLFEHWLEVPEVLAEFATHAETGAAMSEVMLHQLLGAATFNMGFQIVEYVASALVDLAFHEGTAPIDPMQKQAEVLEDIGMPRAISMRHATPHFAHVFSGPGYASGYYSYMWSEVMDADAFASFQEAGGAFDVARARALEEHILSKGGSRDAAELYTRFRGGLPNADALLKGRGFLST
ncbi:MAG: M3 family metallopeptidase [Maritimibacter sp.]